MDLRYDHSNSFELCGEYYVLIFPLILTLSFWLTITSVFLCVRGRSWCRWSSDGTKRARKSPPHAPAGGWRCLGCPRIAWSDARIAAGGVGGCIFLQNHCNLLLFFLLKSIIIIVCLSFIRLLLSVINNLIDRLLLWDVDPNWWHSWQLIC